MGQARQAFPRRLTPPPELLDEEVDAWVVTAGGAAALVVVALAVVVAAFSVEVVVSGWVLVDATAATFLVDERTADEAGTLQRLALERLEEETRRAMSPWLDLTTWADCREMAVAGATNVQAKRVRRARERMLRRLEGAMGNRREGEKRVKGPRMAVRDKRIMTLLSNSEQLELTAA